MLQVQTSSAIGALAAPAPAPCGEDADRALRGDRLPAFAKGRIPSLDGLRAISILLVIACHLARTHDSPLPRSAIWAPLGTVGVDMFFAISGFLITTLLLREQARRGEISLPRFYARRALRILPAFGAFLVALAVFNRFGLVELLPRDWAVTLTYTVNFFTPVSWAVSHIWSLSVEEHFYLVWPLLFAFLGVRRAGAIALVCLLAEPAIRWLTYRYGGGRFDIDFVTFARLDAIAVGCLLAVWSCSPRMRLPLRILDTHATIAFPLAVGALILSTFVLAHSGKYTIIARPWVNAIAISVMVWTAARRPGGFFGRALNWAPLAWIGGLSYGLYLWQQVFLDPGNSLAWMCRFPQNLGLAFAAAAASYVIVERPFLRQKNRLGRDIRGDVSPTTVRPVLDPASSTHADRQVPEHRPVRSGQPSHRAGAAEAA